MKVKARTADISKIVDEMLAHFGRPTAIKHRDLARRLGLNERATRAAVQEVVTRGILPIGAACDAPAGYYVISTAEELRQALGDIEGRIIELTKRREGLRRAYGQRFGETLPIEEYIEQKNGLQNKNIRS